uniref:Uncharacterized protein n=1 Tax=Plectus sambesii TaxID=2011161 RepID=A0A914WYM5_9BILA
MCDRRDNRVTADRDNITTEMTKQLIRRWTADQYGSKSRTRQATRETHSPFASTLVRPTCPLTTDDKCKQPATASTVINCATQLCHRSKGNQTPRYKRPEQYSLLR